MPPVSTWVELARPKQWLKSAFVLMPVPFAVAAGAQLAPLEFGLGTLGFALASSAVYALNDVFDAERDRRHETKRLRPVASGRVGAQGALAYSALLLLGGIGVSLLADRPGATLLLTLYVALNLVYSGGAKNAPLIDVFLLSAGFVLRVLLGCALLEVPPSSWLLLCSSTLALFLALAKRRADLVVGLDGRHRPSLMGYSVGFLDQSMSITGALTLMAYALYCMEAEVLATGREFATLPFVVFGVLDYLRIVQVHDGGDAPIDLLLGSRAIVASGLAWGGAALWSVGAL